MKVVDEKGKLFGKLNLIDLLVIVLIIAAVAVVGLKFLGGGGSGAGAGATKLTYTVRMTAQDERIVEQVAEYVDKASGKRDQLMAGGSLVDGYVVDFWTETCVYNRLADGTVELFNAGGAEAHGLVDICFVIEANVGNTVTSEVGTQEVRIGKTHIVKTTHMEFDCGVIESCTWESAS